MVNIHIRPEDVRSAADALAKDTLEQWKTQSDAYTAARAAVQAAMTRGFTQGALDNWVGGRGKAGNVQEGSKAFLQAFLTELDRLAAEKAEFRSSFGAYLNYFMNLANGVKSADDAAADTMNNILKNLKEGR
ncbi:hypothetical protein [Amycolatopsis nigrescens]|uniref:hypothetical protein n=1 Tax=Amycolatopsis nigrescens TaxID=381445 RepID=UPI000374E297|nr:hypothetical protein [Amycolatopsis nigrescens]